MTAPTLAAGVRFPHYTSITQRVYQMSRSNNVGGWLRGTTIRKGGTTNNSRSGTPGHVVVSTSSTIFGGGVKDPSGRTSEFYVSHHAFQNFVSICWLFCSLWMINVLFAGLIDILIQNFVCWLALAITKCKSIPCNSSTWESIYVCHRCESCIDRLFTLGPAPCPICSKVLRKLAFTPQTFEDLTVEKEVAIRRRIAKEFNKRRDDFPDLRSYNDYLEEVEDISK